MNITNQQFIEHFFQCKAGELNTQIWEAYASSLGWHMMPLRIELEGAGQFVRFGPTRDGMRYKNGDMMLVIINDIEK